MKMLDLQLRNLRIWRARKAGASFGELAETYGLSKTRIRQIVAFLERNARSPAERLAS